MSYYVYILSTKSNTTLYTGVTNDLRKRAMAHKLKLIDGFAKKYRVDKLVYYEVFYDIKTAISREKQIKSGSRQKKIDLIRRMNHKWEDLMPKL